MSLRGIDLFAGAGGWDIACKALGFDPLGIEIDDAACATREAARLRTLQGDVAALDPEDFGPCDLCIASPPCPTYSSAGNGGGRRLTDVVVRCMHELAAGNDTRAEHRQEAFEILEPVYWEDEQKTAANKDREPDREKSKARARRDADMSLLVVEPLRWVLALEPRWIALEQVPDVLGLWSEMAQILSTLGYSTWTGVLSAETFGVPQTRKRAILMADREGRVKPPAPTHQRYVSPPKEDEDAPEGLFEVERVDRIVRPEDRDLLPWVSMAEVLGTTATLRSGNSVAGGERAERKAGEPSVAITSRADNNSWLYDRRQTGGDGTPVPPVPSSEPAPTLTASGLAKGRDQWKQARDSGPGAEREPRSADDPSYTIRANGSGSHPSGVKWVKERPSTTVNGDPRISSPGRHDPEESGSQQKDAIRVSEEEALLLQGFAPDYPVQGTKTQRFQQIGNAVPPPLALAILTQLLGSSLQPVALASSDSEGEQG